MKGTDTLEAKAPETLVDNRLHLPAGILGFEQFTDYMLLANPAEAPFAWLRVTENVSLAFVVINPFLVMPDYKPDIPDVDVEFLGLKEANDALLFNIVTVWEPNRATVNLKGPIVINRHTHVGKQVIVANASNYSVQHPLPVAAATA
jgi:flagellar assembly factor FliW